MYNVFIDWCKNTLDIVKCFIFVMLQLLLFFFSENIREDDRLYNSIVAAHTVNVFPVFPMYFNK